MTRKMHLLSLLAATTVAATLCAAGTTAFAASVEEPLAPGGNVMALASASDSAKITLEVTEADNYLLAVEPWIPDVSEAGTLVATVDDGNDETKDAVTKTLVQNAYMFGAFTADFDLSPATTRLVITTGSATEIELSVTLYPTVETTPLPVDAANPAVLEQYTEYTYSYTPAEGGYYTMHWGTNTTGAEFTVAEKARPDYLTGTTVQDDSYPLYFVEGQEVYFSVMYTGGNESTTADVSFRFDTWTVPHIVYEERVYVPITPVGDTLARRIIPFAEDMTPDTYLLRLNTEPVYPEGTVITAHMVNSDGTVVDVAPTSQFNNLYQVTLTANTTGVYFTSTFNEVFVGSVVADITPSETVEFTEGEAAEVTLKRNEALTCFLMGVTESGTYDIALADLPAESHVSVYDAYGTIVPEGETSGMFAVVLAYPTEYGYEGETTKDAAITFLNNSEETITFRALITKSEVNYNVTLGTATTLQAPAHSSVVYYVPGITGEDYLAEFAKSGDAADGNALVYDYFDRYEPLVFADKPQAIYSFGNITLEEGRTLTYAFVVVNNSDTDNTFTFTFTEANTLLVGEDFDNRIQVNGNSSKDYYIGGITTGRYLIRLTGLPYNADFTVTYNNQVVASDDMVNGYIVVNSLPGQVYAIAKLTVTNNGAASVEFSAKVTQAADGTMFLGRAQTVTLGNDDTSETYNIALEARVSYTATITGTLPEGVSVYAIVNGTYINFVNGTANILLDMDATSIEFTYFYNGTISFSFNVTITEVAE